MRLIYTSKVNIPSNLYEQTGGCTEKLLLGIQFPLYRFLKKNQVSRSDESINTCDAVVIYPLATETRRKLLTFSAFITGHLGIFAFLFQVFDDRGILMQSCCYLQLGLLIMAFIFYLGTFIKDQFVIQYARKQEVQHEEDTLVPYTSTIYCAESCDDLPLNTDWIDGNNNLYYYFTIVLEYLFVFCLIVVECLTIIYIYRNTNKIQQEK
ncbi:hypothetical protein BDA99DRAFT_534773 [Phascolomyces articulosus]|uniref:Uncharacterized protein n=1 Tax=Phascolomyces articulosus TaxID=60185 RepID=A0AAD5PGQ3_9FUNG|nr:hypothetical protein BDA99DRAFT_534773 [Phascolomyces articulosus]